MLEDTIDKYNSANFWEINPQFKSMDKFSDLYKKDKSIGKDYSSRVMWAVVLANHPTKSDWYNIPKKYTQLKDKVIGDPMFDWKKHEYLEEAFREVVLTPAERSLDSWYSYMIKRDAYLKTVDYYFDEYKTDDEGNTVYSQNGNPILVKGTAEQLDKAWGASKSMWNDYAKVVEQIEAEKIKGKSKADKAAINDEI